VIRTPSLLAAVLALCGLLGACNLFLPVKNPELWQTSKVTASSERVLWEVTLLALEKAGFPIGAKVDPAKLSATSGWMISLAPFRGKGYREQCEVRYTPEGTRTWKVEVRVRREKNDDLVRPLDLTYAQWVSEPDNEERARIVLQYVKSMLGTGWKEADKEGATAVR